MNNVESWFNFGNRDGARRPFTPIEALQLKSINVASPNPSSGIFSKLNWTPLTGNPINNQIVRLSRGFGGWMDEIMDEKEAKPSVKVK